MKAPKAEATVSRCALAAATEGTEMRSLMTMSDFHTNLWIPTPPLQARVKAPQIECLSFNEFCLPKQGFKQKESTLSTEHKNAALTAVTCYTGQKSRQDY